MSAQQRREREQAERRRLIIAAARELAVAEGWGAVTTRRLADRIEYSQPVLYKHFASKEDIIGAVALQGFEELASALREARGAGLPPAAGLRALAAAYTDFAAANPTLYEAMFVLSVQPDPGRAAEPGALLDVFAELRAALLPLAGDRDPDHFAELAWAALHGLVTLGGNGRLRGGREPERLALFAEQFTAHTGGAPPVSGADG